MPDQTTKPLISARRSTAIRPGTRLGRFLAKFDNEPVAYRYWIESEPRRELCGSGRFHVEIVDGWLRCRVLGDLFKPTPFEFAFHVFWLTRRGMLLAVFDLAEDRPPDRRSATESFIHFIHLRDRNFPLMAAALLKNRLRSQKGTPP